MDIRHYITLTGVDPFQTWLDGLKDTQGRIAIQRRIDRLLGNNFGDHKFCQDGVWELRIDFGPGYRIYYTQEQKMRWCYCFVAARNVAKPRISPRRFDIGKIISGENHDS